MPCKLTLKTINLKNIHWCVHLLTLIIELLGVVLCFDRGLTSVVNSFRGCVSWHLVARNGSSSHSIIQARHKQPCGAIWWTNRTVDGILRERQLPHVVMSLKLNFKYKLQAHLSALCLRYVSRGDTDPDFESEYLIPNLSEIEGNDIKLLLDV